jgi:pSer/pThr/pTyr-binding forkhead associated (FHA) protein
MDGLVLKEIALTKERTTIGRKPHNDIQIDNLAVSGEHAVIVTILQDSFLEDLGSTNGTVVNGQPVKKHFLQNNDIVELGKYKLKYVNEAPAGQAKAADFERTMVLRPGAMRPAVPAPAPAAAAPVAAVAAAGAKNFGDTVAGGQSATAAPVAASKPAAAPQCSFFRVPTQARSSISPSRSRRSENPASKWPSSRAGLRVFLSPM